MAGAFRIAVTARLAAGASLAMLTACGGGGGGVNSTPTPPAATIPSPTPTPTPAPSPTPTPTPTPTPAPTPNYDTAEYRASVGAVSMNALAAYQQGATGTAIGIGVIDSGIDLQSTQFGSRISAASQDVAGTRGIDDEDGHGTAVAFTAAGARDGSGAQGVAFNSTLIIERADRPGSCGTTSSSGESSCAFPTDAITAGVDAARLAGARVINMSLGGSAMPQTLADAIGRATAAGIVVVIAAGNDGATDPGTFTAVANNDAVARNQVIIAGSVNSQDAISTFSDRAGSEAAHFLTAVGEKVVAPDNANVAYSWSGTSFAAPQISGAVALLAQAFPNLTGAQIVDLLFRTARDAGAAGVDPVYGNGVIDLTRAFQPVGTLSVAGSTTPVSPTSNAALSTAMGDAHPTGMGAVVLDGYSRAFALDLATTIARGSPSPVLAPTLQSRTRNLSMSAGGMTASLTLAPRGGSDWALERTSLTSQDALAANAIAGSVTQKLGSTLSFGFAMAEGSGPLAAQLIGQSTPAFLVARDDSIGFDSLVHSASAMRQQFGPWGVTAAIENGDVLARRDALIAGKGVWRRSGYGRMTVGLDRRLGALSLAASASRLAERNTLLGARFDPSLGGLRATSWFAEARARFDAGDGWTLGGSMRRGWTRAIAGYGLVGDGRLGTSAFAADIGKDGVIGADSIGLRVSQPLRVANGGVDLTMPTYWDYATSAVTQWTSERLNLTPRGRELDVEARYARPWLGGDVETNLFWRRDPGNIAALLPDYGWALRYSVGF